ncbi:hypothetical protein ACFWMR_01980 [Amycolatopsis thailandensis]|uniref:hypothetical protein n=1 Tax=Amycolatopsis thailandensis TaxID=589330 RepID=UPI00365B19AF
MHDDQPTVWKIAIRDDIRAHMCTYPSPQWASTEAEKDWVLEHLLHRPREDYTVEAVPGPILDAIPREQDRFARVRKQLWRESFERRFPDRPLPKKLLDENS